MIGLASTAIWTAITIAACFFLCLTALYGNIILGTFEQEGASTPLLQIDQEIANAFQQYTVFRDECLSGKTPQVLLPPGVALSSLDLNAPERNFVDDIDTLLRDTNWTSLSDYALRMYVPAIHLSCCSI